MALQLDVKIFDLVQILDAALADCGIVEEIYDRDQYAIKVQAVVSREKQIAVRGVRPKIPSDCCRIDTMWARAPKNRQSDKPRSGPGNDHQARSPRFPYRLSIFVPPHL